MNDEKTEQPVAVAGCARCEAVMTSWHAVRKGEGSAARNVLICRKCFDEVCGGRAAAADHGARESNAGPRSSAAHGSAHSCEWENVTKGLCASRAEFLDAHGKKLCAFHASHLARRFHAPMRPIENAPNEKLSD